MPPYRLKYWNTWSLVGSAICRGVEDATLLEEICHWVGVGGRGGGWGGGMGGVMLRLHKLTFHSLLMLDVIPQLPALAPMTAYCHASLT